MLFIPHALKNSLLPTLEHLLDKDTITRIAWVSNVTPEQAFSFAEHVLSSTKNEQAESILRCFECYYSFLYTQVNEQAFKSLLAQVQTLLRKNISPKISCIFDTTKKSILIKEYQPQKAEHKTIFPDSKKNKNILYTCITGNYDGLIQHTYYSPEWDYYCFTDQKNLLEQKTVGHWQIKELQYQAANPQLTGRWHKIHPHIILAEYDQCLYVDGNINILSPYLFELVNEKQYILGQFIHPVRDCIYEEIVACLAGKKENKAKLEKVKNFLLQNQFPSHFGLSETGILFRQHKNPLCIKIMDEWWFMLENYSVRDQISLMYILWKNKLQPEWLCPYAYRQLKHDFTVIQHKKTLIIP